MAATALTARLTAKVTLDESGCWVWSGKINNAGYGQLTVRGRTVSAHRASYEVHIGPIPAGLHIDHLCRNRRCINPAHLEPVTPQENILRSPIAPAAVNSRKTSCPKGHPYDEANTIVQTKGSRLCRTCQSAPRRFRRQGIA